MTQFIEPARTEHVQALKERGFDLTELFGIVLCIHVGKAHGLRKKGDIPVFGVCPHGRPPGLKPECPLFPCHDLSPQFTQRHAGSHPVLSSKSVK
jgi:hypothetical protein